MTWQALAPLPTRDLSPNGSRGHWSKTAKARREYRDECAHKFALGAPKIPMVFVVVHRTMRICKGVMWVKGQLKPGTPLSALMRYRPTDQDNAAAALKPLLDALQQEGVIKTDRYPMCSVPAVEFEQVDTFFEEGVWVEIQEVEGA